MNIVEEEGQTNATVDEELVDAHALLVSAMVKFEDDTNNPARHVVIPSDLEIQSLVMLAASTYDMSYELSDNAKEVYCT